MEAWAELHQEELESETFFSLRDIAFSPAERGLAVGVVQQDLVLSAPPVILLTVDALRFEADRLRRATLLFAGHSVNAGVA